MCVGPHLGKMDAQVAHPVHVFGPLQNRYQIRIPEATYAVRRTVVVPQIECGMGNACTDRSDAGGAARRVSFSRVLETTSRL